MCKIGNYIDFWLENFDPTSISAGHSCIKLSDYINDHRIHMWVTLTQTYRLLKTFTAIRNTITSFVIVHNFLPWHLVHFGVWKITTGIPQFSLVTSVFSF